MKVRLSATSPWLGMGEAPDIYEDLGFEVEEAMVCGKSVLKFANEPVIELWSMEELLDLCQKVGGKAVLLVLSKPDVDGCQIELEIYNDYRE